MESKPKRPHSQSQRQRFIEAAKEAGCSEDETAFDNALRKVGRFKDNPEKDGSRPKKRR